jgi:PIN domain nuclease of toxin-antitoxin system
MKYVLDACALFAFLNKEGGWEKVRALLVEAAGAGNIQVFMNSANLIEVYYDRLRLDDALKLGRFSFFIPHFSLAAWRLLSSCKKKVPGHLTF